MADTQLLPCPFCGGTDAFVERADYSSAFVVCDSRVDEHSVCMARGPIAVQDDDGEEIPGGAGAIAAWNRRAALASRPAEVDDEGLLDAAEAMLGVLDGYPDQLVPINRQSATVRYLRNAVASDRAWRGENS